MRKRLFLLFIPIILFFSNLFLISIFKDSKFDDFLIFLFDYSLILMIINIITNLKDGFKELNIKEKIKENYHSMVPILVCILQISYSYYDWYIFQFIVAITILIAIFVALFLSFLINIYNLLNQNISLEIKSNKKENDKLLEQLIHTNSNKFALFISFIITFLFKKENIYKTKQLKVPPLSF